MPRIYHAQLFNLYLSICSLFVYAKHTHIYNTMTCKYVHHRGMVFPIPSRSLHLIQLGSPSLPNNMLKQNVHIFYIIGISCRQSVRVFVYVSQLVGMLVYERQLVGVLVYVTQLVGVVVYERQLVGVLVLERQLVGVLVYER